MQLSLLTLLISTVCVLAADADSASAGTVANQPSAFMLEPETNFIDKKATLVVPPLRKIRDPESIQRDVLEIQDAVKNNEKDYTWYNVRIQELLFERFMVYDPAFTQMSLDNLDSIFQETYAVLYNKIFNNPEINKDRQARYQRAIKNMISSRMPYIEIMYTNQLSPNMPDFRTVMSSVIDSRIIGITKDSQAPEDRMADHLSDASDVLQQKVLSLDV